MADDFFDLGVENEALRGKLTWKPLEMSHEFFYKIYLNLF
jgi:hypothetical protein